LLFLVFGFCDSYMVSKVAIMVAAQ
jgi:hypothetical protein